MENIEEIALKLGINNLDHIKELANLSMQNLSGRESDEDIFNTGIDAGIEEILNKLYEQTL